MSGHGNPPRKDVREALRPFAKAYADIFAAVRDLDDSTLRLLIDAPAELTQTNCWWAEYGIVADVAGEATYVLRTREGDRDDDRTAE